MFEIEKAIEAWRQELLSASIKDPEVLAELENHLRENAVRLANSGETEEKIFQKAVEQLGNNATLREEFSKVQNARFWSLRNGTVIRITVSLWFLLGALQWFRFPWEELHSAILIRWGRNNPDNLNGFWFLIHNRVNWMMCAHGCMNILIIMGLLKHQNRWRIAALITCCLQLTHQAVSVLYVRLFLHPFPQFQGVACFYFGFRLPDAFLYVLPVLFYSTALWTVYYLSKEISRTRSSQAKLVD